MKLSILTPTYNHPEKLKLLYKALIAQEDRFFTWFIVNDGSEIKTDEVIKSFISDNILDIRYITQTNKGKSAAINNGLDSMAGYDFVLIVDDDEELFPNATIIVKDYYEKFKGRCACINFNRANIDGTPLTNGQELSDLLSNPIEQKNNKYHADGYIGYYLEKLGKLRFPLFDGEKYMGPSVLIMLVSDSNPMLLAKSIIGKTEYLEGGITKQGRKLRLKNPKGMIFHSLLFMRPEYYLKYRIAYSIRAYAYMYYSGFSKNQLLQEGLDMSKFYNLSLIGKVVSLKWKWQYGSLK